MSRCSVLGRSHEGQVADDGTRRQDDKQQEAEDAVPDPLEEWPSLRFRLRPAILLMINKKQILENGYGAGSNGNVKPNRSRIDIARGYVTVPQRHRACPLYDSSRLSASWRCSWTIEVCAALICAYSVRSNSRSLATGAICFNN